MTSNSFGYQYQYYYFSPQKVKSHKSTYLKYVRPQLRSIVQEYYVVIKKLVPDESELINIKKNTKDIKDSWEKGKHQCFEEGIKKCEALLIKIKKSSISLEKKVATFRFSKIKYNNDQKMLDRLLSLSGWFNKLSSHIYLLQHKLDNRIIDEYDPKAFQYEEIERKSITKLLSEMNFYADAIVIEFMPKEYKAIFEGLQNGMISEIENKILPTHNQKYLINSLGNINMSWSSFHMQLERGNLDIPFNILGIIDTMRRRWNSILKLYMKNETFIPKDKVQKPTLR